jgi:hypothetical protein
MIRRHGRSNIFERIRRVEIELVRKSAILALVSHAGLNHGLLVSFPGSVVPLDVLNGELMVERVEWCGHAGDVADG